ncbi:MAG: putative zinc-binding metallopeptidase [Verrucomicrobiae bacterium]|nr:putative zinc-binding metallopeptidase [Verrucomicrobiae bacterium]
MKSFHCDHCGALLAFENVRCLRCDVALGLLPDLLDLSALKAEKTGLFRALAPAAADRSYRRCPNGLQHEACNWYVPVADPEPFCLACRLNEMIPDPTVAGNGERWLRVELAKRRLVYTLLRLGLPLHEVAAVHSPALRFRFLGDVPGAAQVLTGHEAGVITLNIAEADEVERERRRVSLHEPLRTLPAHFRHEAGHFYWGRLVASSAWLEPFRQVFGDETADYAVALEAYHRQGPPLEWLERGVSAYASAHPWEDWAETWAHYLHMVDTLETAAGFGLSVKPRHPAATPLAVDPGPIIQSQADFDAVFANWLPLTLALNSINRGMGLPDLYPFVLAPAAVEKLRFVHSVITEAAAGRT